MKQNDLTILRQYCESPDCGIPTVTQNGTEVRIKQPMKFLGFTENGRAEYVCLECSERYEIVLNKAQDGFHRTEKEGRTGFEWILLVFLLVVIACGGFQGLLKSLGLM